MTLSDRAREMAAELLPCHRAEPWCQDKEHYFECPAALRPAVTAAFQRLIDERRTPESVSLLEQHCSDADFETIGRLRDESYAAGYQAARDDAARLNLKQVEHVVALGPRTTRTLVAAILYSMNTGGGGVDDAANATDTLLAELAKKEK